MPSDVHLHITKSLTDTLLQVCYTIFFCSPEQLQPGCLCMKCCRHSCRWAFCGCASIAVFWEDCTALQASPCCAKHAQFVPKLGIAELAWHVYSCIVPVFGVQGTKAEAGCRMCCASTLCGTALTGPVVHGHPVGAYCWPASIHGFWCNISHIPPNTYTPTRTQVPHQRAVQSILRGKSRVCMCASPSFTPQRGVKGCHVVQCCVLYLGFGH